MAEDIAVGSAQKRLLNLVRNAHQPFSVAAAAESMNRKPEVIKSLARRLLVMHGITVHFTDYTPTTRSTSKVDPS